jgi:hypothetical protein
MPVQEQEGQAGSPVSSPGIGSPSWTAFVKIDSVSLQRGWNDEVGTISPDFLRVGIMVPD